MSELDIPIFKKSYDLYRVFYGYRLDVAKQDRYTLWQRCEDSLLAVIELILLASQSGPKDKLPILERASVRLNLLREHLPEERTRSTSSSTALCREP